MWPFTLSINQIVFLLSSVHVVSHQYCCWVIITALSVRLTVSCLHLNSISMFIVITSWCSLDCPELHCSSKENKYIFCRKFLVTISRHSAGWRLSSVVVGWQHTPHTDMDTGDSNVITLHSPSGEYRAVVQVVPSTVQYSTVQYRTYCHVTGGCPRAV